MKFVSKKDRYPVPPEITFLPDKKCRPSIDGFPQLDCNTMLLRESTAVWDPSATISREKYASILEKSPDKVVPQADVSSGVLPRADLTSRKNPQMPQKFTSILKSSAIPKESNASTLEYGEYDEANSRHCSSSSSSSL